MRPSDYLRVCQTSARPAADKIVAQLAALSKQRTAQNEGNEFVWKAGSEGTEDDGWTYWVVPVKVSDRLSRIAIQFRIR